MARTMTPEAIDYVVSQEKLLVGVTKAFMRGLMNGVKPDKFRESMVSTGLSGEQADALLAIVAMACASASRIKGGETRNAVLDETGFPPSVRAVYAKMVDMAIEESGDHDLQSLAGRPCQVKLDPTHWFLRNLDMFGLMALGLLGPALVIFIIGVWLWKALIVIAVIIAGIFSLLVYLRYAGVKWQFKDAHLGPAKVVNLTPRLIATHSNLCNNSDVASSSDCYVVKVSDSLLTDAEFSKIGLGGFVAVSCSFGPESKEGQWEDVHPLELQNATANNDVILKSLRRIPDQDWNDLDEALEHLTAEQRRTPGLYRVPAPAHELKAAGKPAPTPARKAVAAEVDDDLKLM